MHDEEAVIPIYVFVLLFNFLSLTQDSNDQYYLLKTGSNKRVERHSNNFTGTLT